jgi:hypothetical protein
MEKEKINLIKRTAINYNKINNIKRPFKDIKFTVNNQNNNPFFKDRRFHNKYLVKTNEKNKTILCKSPLANIIDNNNTNDYFKKDKKYTFLNKDITENKDNKENKKKIINKFNFNKIRYSSQAQRNLRLINSPPKNNFNNKDIEEDDDNNDDGKDIDINLFFDKINKEFNDIGKMIKITFVVDEKRKYDYIKNEYVLLKIIENDLKESYELNIKELIYKEQKLKVFKSLKDNKLEDNCVVKVVLEE